MQRLIETLPYLAEEVDPKKIEQSNHPSHFQKNLLNQAGMPFPETEGSTFDHLGRDDAAKILKGSYMTVAGNCVVHNLLCLLVGTLGSNELQARKCSDLNQ